VPPNASEAQTKSTTPVLKGWPSGLVKPYEFIIDRGARFVRVYQTEVMPAPAFHYFETLDEAKGQAH
jgi:hypothetical protein